MQFVGYVVVDDPYTHPTKTAKSHERLKSACTTHVSCAKRRGRGLAQTRRHGEWEPVAFLIEWQRLARVEDTPGEHVKMNPSAREVEDVAAELRDAHGD